MVSPEERVSPGGVLALWKPWGHVTGWNEKGGHPGLAPLLAGARLGPDVRPVGRLDHDSEGLLLLTADGALSHALTDPRGGHPRTYWAQVERVPDEAALDRLRAGVPLDGRPTRPCQARLLAEEPALPPRPVPIRARKSVPTAWVELVLSEGRNRQVRRVTAAVGHPTLRLVRAAVGPLRLLELGLQPGSWRWLTAAEEQGLRAMAGRGGRG